MILVLPFPRFLFRKLSGGSTYSEYVSGWEVMFALASWLVVLLLIGVLVVPGGEAFGISSWVWQDGGVSRGNAAVMCSREGKLPDGAELLKQRFSDAPEAELCRFLAKQRGDVEKAATVYGEALEWRRERKGQQVAGVENVPEWMWKFETGRARDNTTVLWVQGAMYDSRAADAAAYVEDTVVMLERSLPADSRDMLTVLVDVRAYPGMPSEPASRVVTYLAKVAPVLCPPGYEEERKHPQTVSYHFPLSDASRTTEKIPPRAIASVPVSRNRCPHRPPLR